MIDNLIEKTTELKEFQTILIDVLGTDNDCIDEFIKQFGDLTITVKLPNAILYVDDEQTFNKKIIESVKFNKNKLISDKIMEDLILCGLTLRKDVNNIDDEDIKKIYYKIFV